MSPTAYIPTATGGNVAALLDQLTDANAPQTNANDRISLRETGNHGVQRDQGHSVHWYSRNKEGIRAENLRTLALIKDAVGARGLPLLQRFERALSEGVRKGDKPLTIAQFRANLELVEQAGGFRGEQSPRSATRDLTERQGYFLQKTANLSSLSREDLNDALENGKALIWEGIATFNAEDGAKGRLHDMGPRVRALQAELDRTDPLSPRAFQDGVIGMFEAATRLVQKLPEDNADKTRLLVALNAALGVAMADTNRAVVTPGSDAAREIKGNAQQAIKDILNQMAGMTLEGGEARLSKKDIQRQFREASVAQLDQGGRWEMVTKNVRIGDARNPVAVISTITPAGHTGAHFVNDYQENGLVTGVSSTDTGNRRHAVNLARSTLADAAGNTIFRAVRHGVCSAFGIGNKAARIEANRTRAVEILTLSAQDAILANPALLDGARGNPPQITLPLVSLSLLTPDALRIGAGNEARFLREQNAAWQSLAGENPEITVELPPPAGQAGRNRLVTLRVQPQLATFNFPVNTAPQGNAFIQRLVGGYFTSEPQNEKAFDALLGADFMKNGNLDNLGGIAGERIAGLAVQNPQKAVLVRALASQCRELWQSGGHRDSAQTPYRLPARLAVLTSLLGFPPAFNCKSGKDRTGQMDVEAKTIAAFIAQHGRVPSLDGQDDAVLQQIRLPMALDGGNHEMQIKNTGYAGFKTLGVRGLTESMGGREPMTRVIGFSKLVKD